MNTRNDPGAGQPDDRQPAVLDPSVVAGPADAGREAPGTEGEQDAPGESQTEPPDQSEQPEQTAQPEQAEQSEDGSTLEQPAGEDDPEEVLVDPARVRRRPRIGRFVFMGVAAGVLIGLILSQLGALQPVPGAGDATYSRRDLAIILIGYLTPIGALLGAGVAWLLDRRSRR